MAISTDSLGKFNGDESAMEKQSQFIIQKNHIMFDYILFYAKKKVF